METEVVGPVARLVAHQPLRDERLEHAVQGAFGKPGGLLQVGERRGAAFAGDGPQDRDPLGEGGGAGDGIGNGDCVVGVVGVAQLCRGQWKVCGAMIWSVVSYGGSMLAVIDSGQDARTLP